MCFEQDYVYCCGCIASQVVYTRVYIRKEPKLTSKMLCVKKEGTIIDVDAMKGSWGRVVWPDGDEEDGWVLTRHHMHGNLLELQEDSTILLPGGTALDRVTPK